MESAALTRLFSAELFSFCVFALWSRDFFRRGGLLLLNRWKPCASNNNARTADFRCRGCITAAMAWTPGTRVGDYEIVGTLGYGGMGEVYRVRHTISDRMEAMKLLRAAPRTRLQAQEMMDRFVPQSRLAATWPHPQLA